MTTPTTKLGGSNTSSGTLSPGVYVIRNKASGTVVDLDYHGNAADGTTIQGYTALPTKVFTFNQSWLVEKVAGNNFYTLTNIRSNTVLDLSGANAANGTKVHGWRRNGTNAQHWYISGNDQAGYSITNVGTGTVLDLWGGGSANGTAITCFKSHGGGNQTWFLDLASGSALSGGYVVRNKASGTVIDLHNGDTANGTKIQGWTALPTTTYTFNQIWLIEKVAGNNFYTLANVRSNTLLDLQGGNSANGTKVYGVGRNGTNAQRWYIVGNDQVGYRFINVGTRTVLDLWGGHVADGTAITCFGGHGGDNQTWSLDRRSRRPTEVDSLLRSSPSIGQVFKHYISDGNYLTLPEEVLRSIWSSAGIGSRTWRPESYDCDDFAFAMKGAVADWCYTNIRGPVAICIGIMYGRHPDNRGHAYNWYIGQDLSSIVIFEPQNGKSSPDSSYTAYFGIY